jgi:hypothetical protein
MEVVKDVVNPKTKNKNKLITTNLITMGSYNVNTT